MDLIPMTYGDTLLNQSFTEEEMKSKYPTLYDCMEAGDLESLLALCKINKLFPFMYFLSDPGDRICPCEFNGRYQNLNNLIKQRANLEDIKDEAWRNELATVFRFYNIETMSVAAPIKEYSI